MDTLQVDTESLFIHERYITDGAIDIFVSILAIFGISIDTSLNRCVIVFANLILSLFPFNTMIVTKRNFEKILIT